MYIIGIFEAIVAIGAFLLIPKDKVRLGPRERIDWAGGFLVTSGLVLFCFGLTYFPCPGRLLSRLFCVELFSLSA